ncbi:MAG: FAD-dependent monooxygenase, partial [Gammaproteobacteria bacterium]|nr:FAD-dependent monooxygenase [Gammaproteobacteria bacterium]
HVGEKGRLGATRLHAEEEGVAALGYTVRNSVFLKNLYARLEQCPNVDLQAPASVVSIAQQVDRVDYEYERDSVMEQGSASLLLAADGSNSAVRQMVSISQTEKPYDQAAVIANVACERDHENWAWERFTESGPLAMLPLGPKLMAMVYTVDLVDLEQVLALDDEQMLAALQQRFGFRLGHFREIGKRLGFPLTLLESDQQYRGRVLMMGNSARTLHPVSGQGFNLALRDIALLAESLSAGGRLADPGDDQLLRNFCATRKSDQRSVVRFTDSLVRLFRGRSPGFSHLRGLGLMALDALPPARHLLARQSMGMATRLPNLNTLQAQIRQNFPRDTAS